VQTTDLSYKWLDYWRSR